MAAGAARPERNRYDLLLVLMLLIVGGCNQQPAEVAPPESSSSAVQFRMQLDQAVAQGDWQQADRLVIRELTRQPGQPDLMLLAAQTAIGRKQWEAADERFQAFAEASASGAPDEVVQEWMMVKCSAGNVMQAIDYLRQRPNKSIALHRLHSWLLTRVGDLEGASDQNEILLRHHQARPDELLVLSGSWGLTASMGRFDRDSRVVAAALEKHPEDLRPRVTVALNHWLHNRQAEAIAELDRIVGKHPDYAPAVGMLAFLLADDAQFERLEKLIADQGSRGVEHPFYWYGAGCALREAGHIDQAVACFARSLRHGGDERLAASQLAAALGQADRQQIARAVATRAALLQDLRLACRGFLGDQKKSQRSALRVGQLLLELGRTAEAKAWGRLAATLELDPAEDADEAIAKLVSAERSERPSMHDLLAQIDQHFPLPKTVSLASSKTPSPANGTSDAPPEQTGDPQLAPSEILASPIHFRDEATERGLVFAYDHGDPEGKLGRWIHHSTGGGVAVADFDANGWDDVFFTQGGGHPLKREETAAVDRLFLNDSGQFTRRDVALANVESGGYGQGVAAGDINDDGLPDLYVGNIGPNRLWINNGDGTFRDVTEEAGLSGNRWTSSVAIADLTGDGHSDLVEVSYCRNDRVLEAPCRDPQGRLRGCDPGVFFGEVDRLWVAQGDGTFTERTDWSDVQQRGRGLGVLIADLDQQPGVEVFIANDLSGNHLWQRDDSGAWNEWATVRGLAYGSDGRPQACMGIAYGDPDRDGDFDLLVTNFSQDHNSYYVQRSAGIFADRVHQSGMAEASFPVLGFGTVMDDFDRDGFEDLFVANGLVNQNTDQHGDPFAQPAQIFRWTGRNWAEQLAEASGDEPKHQQDYLSRSHVGRAVARGDFDRDGLADLVVVHLGEPASLLMGRSEPAGDSIGFRLVATRGSRDAVGARVTVTTNQRPRFLQRVAGHGYYCTDSPVLAMGLAEGETIEQVEVHWPSGHRQQFQSISPGRVWTLVEGEAAYVAAPRRSES